MVLESVQGRKNLYPSTMDGETYLRRLIEGYLSELKEASADSNARSLLGGWKLGEAEAAGRALVAAGALEVRQLENLLADLKKALIERGVIQEWSGSISFDLGEAVAERVEGELPSKQAEEWARALDPSVKPTLVRVIAVEQDVDIATTQQKLILISLELWTDHFSLRYATDMRQPLGEMTHKAGRAPFDHFAWELVDDLGVRYKQSGGGGGGGRPWYLWTKNFHPSLPPEAERLQISGRDFETVEELFRVDITLAK
ncbi:MAG: hypothetical protein QOG04_1848 [Actinomycetota bacterium]|jgi:hypothetical protein|nr:hypothetical protein [Actinomycetota bacterium]